MRGLDESTEVLIRTGQKAQEQVKHAWDGFMNFAARDNVLEVALGLMLVTRKTSWFKTIVPVKRTC
jgi:large conductance mechanosensitive channel